MVEFWKTFFWWGRGYPKISSKRLGYIWAKGIWTSRKYYSSSGTAVVFEVSLLTVFSSQVSRQLCLRGHLCPCGPPSLVHTGEQRWAGQHQLCVCANQLYQISMYFSPFLSQTSWMLVAGRWPANPWKLFPVAMNTGMSAISVSGSFQGLWVLLTPQLGKW